ncbi:hypothetical protein [Massilia sp. TSP1-1-2]|uniref:hypothetical protein n=1 Tax=Massilia sp. TSP1-1-2 TaxID=2804649 RepID=UPI003CF6D5DB
MNKKKLSAFDGFAASRALLPWGRRRKSRFRRHPPLSVRSQFSFRFKVIAMSGASAACVLLARALGNGASSISGWAWVLVLAGAVLGALVLGAVAHRFLDRHFSRFKSAKLFGFGLFALATFVAHGQAVGEVNNIFHIDASSLPHATTAASAMAIGAWLFWAVLIPATVASGAWLIRCASALRWGDATITAAIFFAGVTWSAVVGHQAAPDVRRQSNIYRIALAMDFNKRSNCEGVPAASEGVVFIGPDQKRAIVAPPRVDILSRGGFSSLVPQVQVPTEFQIVECR